MAKIPFSKLNLKSDIEVSTVTWTDDKGIEISFEVKRYLPIKEKLELVSRIINQSIDNNGFYNPMRVRIFSYLEVIYAYTNLTFTAKQKEDPFKIYDAFESTGVFDRIIDSMGKYEWQDIKESVDETIESIYSYKNSVLGILETVSSDYNNLNLDASEIQQKLADPENMTLLKDVLEKLG